MERVLRIGLNFPGPSPLTSSLLFCVPHSSFRTGQIHSGVDNRSSGLRPNRTGSQTISASVSAFPFPHTCIESLASGHISKACPSHIPWEEWKPILFSSFQPALFIRKYWLLPMCIFFSPLLHDRSMKYFSNFFQQFNWVLMFKLLGKPRVWVKSDVD